MPIIPTYRVLTSHFEAKIKIQTIITHITKAEEKVLDTDGQITITRGSRTFVLSNRNTYCYGNIDFSEGSRDYDIMTTFSFINSLGFNGVFIPSNYDYDTHTCVSDKPFYKHYETWRAEPIIKYAHACLGKPELIAIFKQIC